MKVLLDKYDEEIEQLEQQLQEIQQAEMKRRQSAAGNSTSLSPLTDKDASLSPTIIIEDIDLVSCVAAAATKPSTAAREVQCTQQSNLCIECNVTPSTHKCQKCKEVSCDLC